MANDYYEPTGNPQTGARGNSATQRNELNLIKQGFDKLPILSGKANKAVKINASGTGLEASEVISDDGSDATIAGDLIVTGGGIGKASDKKHTIPDVTSDTFALLDAEQTLTNKTIVAENNTITTAAVGNLESTELNNALAELQTDIDTRATSTELSAVESTVSNLRSQDTIASATTTDLASKEAGSLTVSGTTTITGLGTASAGIIKRVVFSGALTLTNNAISLILPTEANITTADGDTAEFESLGSGNWRCNKYTRKNGEALINNASSSTFTQSGTGAVARTVQDELRYTITPEQFDAVGDGVEDDTDALKKAFTRAGANGVVEGNGTYLVTSLLDFVECKRVGYGTITFGSDTWDFTTFPKYTAKQVHRFTGDKTLVTDSSGNIQYNHFPVAAYKDGVAVFSYNHTGAHGQANRIAISEPQAVAGAGNLTINGRYAELGSVVIPVATRVSITSTANDSARVFTINGTLAGVPVSYNITGVGLNQTIYSGSAEKMDVVTSVVSDGACIGDISAGLLALAGNVEVRYSMDGLNTTSEPVVIGDGLSDGLNLYYSSSMGVSADGLFVVIYNKINISTSTVQVLRRASRDGILWSEPQVISWDVTLPSSLGIYGDIKSTPNNKLLMSVYSADNNYVFISSDYGLTWIGKLVVTGASPSQGYNELSIAVIDELNWILISRVEYVVTALRQFKTTDGGESFTNMGAINSGAGGGGNVSPMLLTFTKNGELHLGLVWMARNSSSGAPTYPGFITAMIAKASSALTSNSVWGAEFPIVSTNSTTIGIRSGYPTIVYDARTNQSVIIYGDETDEYVSDIKTKRFNFFVNQPDDGDVIETTQLSLDGTGGTPNTYTSRLTNTVKKGRRVTVEFNISVSALNVTGNLTLSGLLYAPLTTGAAGQIELVPIVGALNGTEIYMYMTAGSSSIALRYTSAAGNASSMTAALCNSSTPTIRGRLSYISQT